MYDKMIIVRDGHILIIWHIPDSNIWHLKSNQILIFAGLDFSQCQNENGSMQD